MILIFVYTKTYLRELIRNRSALFFTLFFPAVLTAFFGSRDASSTVVTSIIYCNFAVQTVMLQALGIAIAAARANPWCDYLKTLPVTNIYMITGRIIASLLLALVSVGLIITVNHFYNGASLTWYQASTIILCALAGGIPMGLLAVWLGNGLNPVAARGVLIFLNTLLLFSAMDFSNQGLLKTLIPSHQWFLFSFAVQTHQPYVKPLAVLIIYSLLFYLLADISERGGFTFFYSKITRINHSKNVVPIH